MSGPEFSERAKRVLKVNGAEPETASIIKAAERHAKTNGRTFYQQLCRDADEELLERELEQDGVY